MVIIDLLVVDLLHDSTTTIKRLCKVLYDVQTKMILEAKT